MAVFYVLNILDQHVAGCLEAIRLICNPIEKQRAHVTVRGPYKQEIAIEPIKRKMSEESIRIYGIGNFFEFGQNTVFFRCSSPGLRFVWHKPDYPYNPHLTVYDGKSRRFATRLYEIASRYEFNIDVRGTELQALRSKRGQSDLGLRMAFDAVAVSAVLRQEIELNDVIHWSDDTRLWAADALLAALSKRSIPRTAAFAAAKARLWEKLNLPAEFHKVTAFCGILTRAGKIARIEEPDSILPLIIGPKQYRALTEVERDELGLYYLEKIRPVIQQLAADRQRTKRRQ